METNNFNNQESVKKLDNSNSEKEIDIIDGEGVLELETKIKELEIKNQEEINKYNQIRTELGLDTLDSKNEEAVIKELPSLSSRFQKIKNIGKNLLKAGAFAGVMFGANDAFSASNTGPTNNDKEKKEIKTEVGDFYLKLQEYKIIPESMTEEEFQEKAKDDNWMKQISKKYTEAKGITRVDNPNAVEIKKTYYGLNVENKKENKILSQEERKKELEKIWKEVSKGKYKIGDTVILSDGSSYLIKKYTPGTYKSSNNENQDIAGASKDFKLLKDYTK